jgi:YD repeat-containing protein
MAQGAPIEMRDGDGDRLQLKRDRRRNLQEIRTPHGHWIRFSYDDQSRIQQAEDDVGEWAKYEYNSDGMLTNVFLSSGHRRHYDYEGSLMIAVCDEGGRVLVRNWYQQDHYLKRQEFGNRAVYSYNYDWAPTSHYPSKVRVTLPSGNVKELSVVDSVPEFLRNSH